MRDLKAEGRTLVLTTHDPNLAAAVASYAILMRNGQVLEAGPTQQMLTADRLSATYGVPVQVAHVGDRRVILLP
jgi:iron complex transport system ATP-binding protein